MDDCRWFERGNSVVARYFEGWHIAQTVSYTSCGLPLEIALFYATNDEFIGKKISNTKFNGKGGKDEAHICFGCPATSSSERNKCLGSHFVKPNAEE